MKIHGSFRRNLHQLSDASWVLISDRDKSDRCCVAAPAFKKHDLLANDLSEILSFLIILQRLDAWFNGNYSQIWKIYEPLMLGVS